MSKQQAQEIANTSKTITELSKKLGFNYLNGKVQKIIINLGLNLDHFDRYSTNRSKAIYKVIEKNCPVCGNNFKTKEGHEREKSTCSILCSNKHFAYKRHTEESNLKTSQTLKDTYAKKLLNSSDGYTRIRANDSSTVYLKQCLECKKEFETHIKKRRFCCNSCSAKYKWNNVKYKENFLLKIKERIANGTFSGWKSRSKVKRSFPEQYTQSLLDELGIKTEPEYPCGKWFIDFADVKRKLALEVDGKQHEYPERKIMDEEKDKYLIENGWKIKRYKWKRVICKDDRDQLKNQLIEFFCHN